MIQNGLSTFENGNVYISFLTCVWTAVHHDDSLILTKYVGKMIINC